MGFGLLIWWVIRQLSTGGFTQAGPPSRIPSSRALEILNERYARGEISKEEYEERKKTLEAE